MLFFKKSGKTHLNDVDLEEVRRRVHGIREVSERPASLQLFAKLGEEGGVRQMPAMTEFPVIPRLLPGQIPSAGDR
ncbi:MAG: hypothetical protein GEU75_04615 [Dehalococcoidia bacterium]|nr:hypothetical protein [Dehalococcoidia bacterium]